MSAADKPKKGKQAMAKQKFTTSPLDKYSDDLGKVIEDALLEDLGDEVDINIDDVVRKVTDDVLDFARSIYTKEVKDKNGI